MQVFDFDIFNVTEPQVCSIKAAWIEIIIIILFLGDGLGVEKKKRCQA